MPQAAKPKPIEPGAPTHVQSAGEQEDFHPRARTVAAELGWAGEPDWVTNDIAVVDAQGFLGKVMHEHFIAGAKGEALPLPDPACEHLGIYNAAEFMLVAEALKAVHADGRGAQLTHHRVVVRDLGAATVLNISDAASSAGKTA